MFICLSEEELVYFKLDFVVMNGVKCINVKWKEYGLNLENFIVFNLIECM